jgi:hypothetical protein
MFGNPGKIIMASKIPPPDPITISSWTEKTNPKATHLWSIAYGNGTFVACGPLDGTNIYIVTSPDGDVWTERTAVNSGGDIVESLSIKFLEGKFFMVGYADNTNDNISYVWSSTDGITWTRVTFPTDPRDQVKRVIGIEYDADIGKYVAWGGINSGSLYWHTEDYIKISALYSTDAITWSYTNALTNHTGIDLRYFSKESQGFNLNGAIVVPGDNFNFDPGGGFHYGSGVCKTTNGIDWADVSWDLGTPAANRWDNLKCGAYDPVSGRTFLGGEGRINSTHLLYSDDELATAPTKYSISGWAPEDGIYGISVGPGMMVAIGWNYSNGTPCCATSTDGITWTNHNGSVPTNTPDTYINGIANDGVRFVAVGSADATDAYIIRSNP